MRNERLTQSASDHPGIGEAAAQPQNAAGGTRQQTPTAEPATLRAKADLDIIEVSESEHRAPDDPQVKERAARRLERATPEGAGAAMEPAKIKPWMIALPAMSFVIALVFAVWFLSSGTAVGLMLLAAFGFIILSNAPLIGALWLRQRDKRGVERTVDEEARRLSRSDFGASRGASGPDAARV